MYYATESWTGSWPMPSSPHWGILWSSEIPTYPCFHTCSTHVHRSSTILGFPHPCPSSFLNISVTSSSSQVLLSIEGPVQEIPRQATLFSFFMSLQHLGWTLWWCITIFLPVAKYLPSLPKRHGWEKPDNTGTHLAVMQPRSMWTAHETQCKGKIHVNQRGKQCGLALGNESHRSPFRFRL